MSDAAASVTDIAREYYDSEDADTFYATVWGGEDIHIGLYDEGDTIKDASHKTVLRMCEEVGVGEGDEVLDIGAGYGGAARVLAGRCGARVTCLNLSDVENERNRQLTREQGLQDRITILQGSFEDIPAPSEKFDIVWSQDAILHSGNRERVLDEVARVLKPGGDFIFTDPMQADGLEDDSVLQPIYDRIHLSSLASIAFYRAELSKRGFEEVRVDNLTGQLRTHYARVGEDLERRRASLAGKISDDYMDRMANGLRHWVDGADKGYLAWGILHFRKK